MAGREERERRGKEREREELSTGRRNEKESPTC